MSIRLKLILSYFFLILISLFILAFGLVATTGRMMEAVSNNVFNGNDFGTVVTSVLDTMVELEYMRRHDPDLFEDGEEMAEVEEGIAYLDLSLFVEQKGEIVYESAYLKDFPLATIKDEIQFDRGHDDRIETGDYELDDRFFIIGRWRTGDADDSHVYMIFEAVSKGQFNWNLYGGMYRFVGIVIILLLIVLTIIITRSVIKPLNRLEEATNEIRQGNLDFSVKTRQKDEFGRVMNAFDTMREELKNSIEQQIQYEENRKELIASISHDLKTPITSIKGYVEGIRDGVAGDKEKMDRYLGVIHQKALDLDKLIDDLFLFSKLDLNRIPFNFTGVNAKRFFEDCTEELAMDVRKQGFDFNVSMSLMENTDIYVDAQQIRRVITNVVSNAVKYSDADRRIDFMITEDRDRVHVAIKDYGKGIPEEQLEKIFEKFYRADLSRNQDVMGSGLGLAIARQIMEFHQGLIRAESQVGQGTTIYLDINKAEIES